MTLEPEFDDPELVDWLVDPELTGERLWDEDELPEVLEHQLSGPLVVDLQTLGNVVALEAAQVCLRTSPPIVSYRDLFEHPAPPVRVLESVKRFAHRQLIAPEAELPSRISRFLYFTSIATARIRTDSVISKLPDHEVKAALEWLAGQAWVGDRTQGLVRHALGALRVLSGLKSCDGVDS